VFLESVDYKGVHPRAFKILNELAHDHEIDLDEFKSWLILATKFGSEKNSVFAMDYANYAQVGDRSPQIDGDDDYYSLNKTTMSQSVRKMQYAVRGQIVMRADKLQEEGREIIFTNIGNPQAVGQKAITFFRQVLALTDMGDYGIEHPDVLSMFPADVVKRAKTVRDILGGSGTGSYTGSQGALGFRKDVAKFIEKRDGHPACKERRMIGDVLTFVFRVDQITIASLTVRLINYFNFIDPGNIFLSNGASSAIESVLTTIMSNELCGGTNELQEI